MRIKNYIYLLLPLVCWGCTSNLEEAEPQYITIDGSAFETEIIPFVEDGCEGPATRVNMEGDCFEAGDLMRLRVIAPYAPTSEYGESTWGTSYDDWRLYQWTGNQANWGNVGSNRGFDVDNDFNPSGAPSSIIMPQATPFVFTATTWTEEIHYVLTSTVGSGYESSKVVITFSNVFKADQRSDANYKASNVLWAQQYMQTGSPHVRLSFEHKMAALQIDISEFATELDNTPNAPEVVLTLENMPDIDQQEVAIGNYYVAKMKSRRDFGDYWRCKCPYDDNGKVLGIVVPDEGAKHLVQIPFTGGAVTQTGIYTAHKQDATTFQLIIPPYTVPAGVTPTLWLRQGTKRWSAPLPLSDHSLNGNQTDRTFESGVRYHVTMQAPAVPEPDPVPQP